MSGGRGIVGQAYGKAIHAREVLALDHAGDAYCWVKLARFGDEWLLIRAAPGDVAAKVRKVRGIPPGASSDRFPAFHR